MLQCGQNWFWFYLWLNEKVHEILVSQLCSVVDVKPIPSRHSNDCSTVKDFFGQTVKTFIPSDDIGSLVGIAHKYLFSIKQS